MKNWKLTPTDPKVAKYIDCYWFLEREVGDTGNHRPKLNPDPAAHLIIVDAELPYHYEHELNIQTGFGSHWIFAHRNTFIMNHAQPFRMLGIKFKVGALYSLALSGTLPTLDKVDCIALNQWAIGQSFLTQDLLTQAQSHQIHTRDLLDKTLSPWLSTIEDDRHSELTRAILPLLNSRVNISEIGERLHRSQRTIERSFLKTTQLTLKQCKSMIRLEEILNYLYKLDEKEINWPDLACKFQFSDQPHLIRYLKSAIGATPSDYAAMRDLTIDVYGDFELS